MRVCLVSLESLPPELSSRGTGMGAEPALLQPELPMAELCPQSPAEPCHRAGDTPRGHWGSVFLSVSLCSSQHSHPPRSQSSLAPDRLCSKVTLWVCTLSSPCASRLWGQWMLALPGVSPFPGPASSSNHNSQPCSLWGLVSP